MGLNVLLHMLDLNQWKVSFGKATFTCERFNTWKLHFTVSELFTATMCRIEIFQTLATLVIVLKKDTVADTHPIPQ